MVDSFLGRWSQRKADAREGKPLTEPEVAPTPEAPPPSAVLAQPTAVPGVPTAMPVQNLAANADQPGPPPPLTLQDAQALNKDSDFKPFIDRGVDPTVRNTAMKKLFTDPHFNVMDGLDTYIDDYSQPDPLPLAMLRQMASAQFLKLVDAEPERAQAGGANAEPLPDPLPDPLPPLVSGPDATPLSLATPAATPSDPTPLTRQDHYANPDLRLQPDHAAGRPDLGSGAA